MTLKHCLTYYQSDKTSVAIDSFFFTLLVCYSELQFVYASTSPLPFTRPIFYSIKSPFFNSSRASFRI